MYSFFGLASNLVALGNFLSTHCDLFVAYLYIRIYIVSLNQCILNPEDVLIDESARLLFFIFQVDVRTIIYHMFQ